MNSCRSCRKPIEWVTTTKGKRVPVNPDYRTVLRVKPYDFSSRKKVTVVSDQGEMVVGWEPRPGDPEAGLLRGRLSHFATCPQAGSWER